MNTRENNAAIARFLGWTEQTDPTERWFGCWKSEFNTYHKEEVLKSFSSDWDYIMAVVDKIENLGYWTEMCSGSWGGIFKIGKLNSETSIVDIAEKSKIGAAYNAVVEFIKWYNQNNK